MRKAFTRLVCLVFCLVTLQQANTQVYSGNLTLATQAEVDAFNYTEVTGILFIGTPFSTAINNLDGLSELTKVGGSVIISYTSITHVNGLSNLTSIGALVPSSRSITVANTPSLTNLDGLSALQTVNSVQIRDNSALANINGLSNINPDLNTVIIENNDALVHINGLSSVTSVREIVIDDNDALLNINGLSNLTEVEFRVVIDENDVLTNVNGLTGLVSPEGYISIKSNDALVSLLGLSNLTYVGNLDIQFNPVLTNLNGLNSLMQVGGTVWIDGNIHLASLQGLSNLESIDGNLRINVNSYIIGGDNLGLPNLNGLEKLVYVGGYLQIKGNKDLYNFCGLSNLFENGTIVGTIEIENNGAHTVFITAPPDIVLNNDPGQCSKDISAVAPVAPTVDGCLNPGAPSSTGHNLNNIYPVGTTNIIWTVTDGAGNRATALQQIIITDNEPPVITQVPADANVSCAADVPTANTASVTATDNCPNVTISHVGDVITNQTCVNRFTLTRTYKATDNVGNTATRSQVITVYDNVAPVIDGLTASKQMLAPPNHKFHDIEVSYDVTDNCVATPSYSISVSSDEPVNGTGDGDTDPDWLIDDDHNIRLRAERAATGDGRVYTILVTANDGCNAAVTATTTVTVAHNITGPHSGNTFRVGSAVALSGEFWDIPGNRHTAKWLVDGSTAKGSVTEPSGNKNGKVTGSYKFNTPGVYKLQMNVTDQKGVTTYANTNGDLEAIVVIYDPNGGNTYGGGYFNSPAGAFTADPSITGKVSYGFAMNYFKNSTFPKGETQFEFKVGEFEFNALNFDYLVIGNTMAQFKGTGKITGGQSGISFIMSAIDGDLDGSGMDKVRIKIYNKNTGQVYYDNQPGASEADLPVTPVGGNSTVVINNNQVNTITSAPVEEQPDIVLHSFRVMAYPNPGNSQFTLRVNSADFNNKVTMQVSDVLGRVIENKTITANENIIFGQMYKPGVYYLKIIQGENQRQLKLIKLHD